MSEHHEEAHTGPIKTPKQLLLAVAYSFILPVFIIIGLVYFVTSDNKPQAGSTNASESVAARIQKVGSVEIKSANAEPRSGEEVFKGQCGGCHTADCFHPDNHSSLSQCVAEMYGSTKDFLWCAGGRV